MPSGCSEGSSAMAAASRSCAAVTPSAGMQRRRLRVAERQRAGLVEDDGVHPPEHLEVDAPLHDRALPGRAADGAQDRERRPGRDPARAGDDDDGDRRARVAREDEGQSGRAEREVDEVAREAVGRLLDRCARLLGALDGLDDLRERRVAADARRAHLESTGLVDGPREHARPRHLLDRQRLAGDGRLVDERVPARHDAVHRASVHPA